MSYHLNNQGKDLGIFPLEELRRRRAAGELTGREWVWCKGMRDWQPLDAILASGAPRRSNSPLIAALVAGALALCLLLAAAGYEIRKFVKQLPRPGLENLSENSAYQGKSAVDVAGAPVQWTSNTLTAADIRKKQREFRERQYLENYKKFGRHDSPVDADALRLINNWIIWHYGTPEEQTNTPSPDDLSSRLAADPACDDPLVLTVAASCSVELHEAVRRYERAVAGFPTSKYPGYPRFYANVSLADQLVKDREDRQPVLDAAAVEALKEALKDGSIRPGDQDDIADLLVFGWARGFFDRNGPALCAAARDSGKSFKWLALVLEGEFEIQEAWKARGGGFVNTVSEKGWSGFSEHLANARRALTDAWKLRPDLPLAPERMIYVSLGDSDIREMRLWFDRTTAVQLDHFKAWSDLRWGLRPRWYGNLDAMRALGIAALDTKRFDTDVPRQFFCVISDMESEMDLPHGEHIYGRADIWPDLQQMYEGYIRQPGPAPSRDDWRSGYAAAAFLAGKYDVARTQLEALHWKPGVADWGTDLSAMALETAARTGPLGKRIEAAETARLEGDIGGALRLYQDLQHEAIPDARTAAFVSDRLKTLAVERGLGSGAWVDLLPDDTNFTGWNVERGQWKVLPDGSLEVESDESGHIIYSRARVGRRFEIRGELLKMRSSDDAFQGGIVIGLPEPESSGWDGFRLKRNRDEGDVVSFAEGWTKNQVYFPAKLRDDVNSFDLRFEPERISASLNGQDVFHNVKPPRNYYFSTNEIHIGLGAFNDMNKTTMRYRRVQIRALPGD